MNNTKKTQSKEPPKVKVFKIPCPHCGQATDYVSLQELFEMIHWDDLNRRG